MKIIVIGSGAAGISAIQSICQNDPNKEFNITLISSERELTYSPCALPYIISGEIPYKRLARLDKDFFKKMKIQTFWGSPVCKIIPTNKSVVLKNGRTFFYDKLLIATGSVPIKPPIAGIDKKGIFCVDNLSNTRRIKNYLRREKIVSSRGKSDGKVAIIGAGFTGIEIALALRKQGVQVVIIEMLEHILARMLDSDFSDIVQQKISSLPSNNTEKEIEFKLSTEVTEIKGKEKVKSIELKNGDNIAVDMVVVSIGVRPNIEFLNGSGIITNKGIVVNTLMQTNIPEIYAAGDVAETFDYLTGEKTISAIWPNAVEQGRIAALNIIVERERPESFRDGGKETHYEGAYSINVLNLDGIPVISMGKILNISEPLLIPPPSGSGSVLKGLYTSQNEKSIRRLFFTGLPANQILPRLPKGYLVSGQVGQAGNNTMNIIGFESIGEFRNLGFIWSCIQKRTSLSELSSNILADIPSFLETVRMAPQAPAVTGS